MVERFLAAIRTGDVDGLLSVLAPDVVAVGDGGGLAPAARLPIQGAHRVAKSLLLVARTEGLSMHSMWVNGALAITIEHDGKRLAVASVRVEGGRITALYGVTNPEKPTRLDRETQLVTDLSHLDHGLCLDREPRAHVSDALRTHGSVRRAEDPGR